MSSEVRTATNQKLLYCCCYRPPDANLSWMNNFRSLLNHACEKYENILIVGDFNLPNIRWDAVENTIMGTNEQNFEEMLNNHFLFQLNNTPTRGNNIRPRNNKRSRSCSLNRNSVSMLSRSILMHLLKLQGSLSEPFTTTRKEIGKV